MFIINTMMSEGPGTTEGSGDPYADIAQELYLAFLKAQGQKTPTSPTPPQQPTQPESTPPQQSTQPESTPPQQSTQPESTPQIESEEEREKRIEIEQFIRLLRQSNLNLQRLPATITKPLETLDLKGTIDEMNQMIQDSESIITKLDSDTEEKVKFYQSLLSLEENPSNKRDISDERLIEIAHSINLKYFLDNFPGFRKLFSLQPNSLQNKYGKSKIQIKLLREAVAREKDSSIKISQEVDSETKSRIEELELFSEVCKIISTVNKILSVKIRVFSESFVDRSELIRENADILFNYLKLELFHLFNLIKIHNLFIKGELHKNESLTGLRRMDTGKTVDVVAGRYTRENIVLKMVARLNLLASQASTSSSDYENLPNFRISIGDLNSNNRNQNEYASLRVDTDFTVGVKRIPVISIDISGYRDIGGIYPLYRNEFYKKEILDRIQVLCSEIAGVTPVAKHHFIISRTGTTDSISSFIKIMETLRLFFNGDV